MRIDGQRHTLRHNQFVLMECDSVLIDQPRIQCNQFLHFDAVGFGDGRNGVMFFYRIKILTVSQLQFFTRVDKDIGSNKTFWGNVV